MPGKSHMVVNAALMKELAYRGHEVTVVSPFPENKKIPNYKDIVLDLNVYERFLSETGKQQFNIVYDVDIENVFKKTSILK